MQTFNRVAMLFTAIAPLWLLPSAIAFGTARSAIAASPREIAQVAKATTVRILSKQVSGSGVLIAKQDQTYFLLTCSHVVSSSKSEAYQIRTPDGQRFSAASSQVQRFDGLNLALVSFQTSQNYLTASLGNSNNLMEGDAIYVSGFPQPANGRNRDLDEFQFTTGIVSSRLNSVRQDGYDFAHTSLTYTGMGGAPVFNDNGQLVGVHCGGDRSIDNTDIKTGFNWGILINTFVQKAQKLGINFGVSAISPHLQNLNNSISPPATIPRENTTNPPDIIINPPAAGSLF